MKLIHLADLHFGKTLHDIPLAECDQPYWADRFLELARSERPDAVLIAGDVYDRSSPSGEAVSLLDDLLTRLSQMDIAVMLTSGNHDSGRKLSFANRMLEKQNIYIAGVPSEEIYHITLEDSFGPVTFWLMPYVFPAMVSELLGADDIRDYDTAVRRLIERQDIDKTARNVLVAHQNVTRDGQQAQRGGSETMVAGVGGIEYTAFDDFDYVALGHIHAAQPVGRDTVRYAGSPLCYHFSETRQTKKGPVIITLGEKGSAPEIRIAEIAPLHPMREIRGVFADIIEREKGTDARGEYLRVVLTDCAVTPDRADSLRELFKSHGSVMLEIVSEASGYANTARSAQDGGSSLTDEELFTEFFTERCGASPDEKQSALISKLAELTEKMDGGERADRPAQRDIDALVDFLLKQECEG